MLEWKAPASDEWAAWKAEADALLKKAGNGDALSEAEGGRLAELVHRMAGERLDPMQQLQMERIARRLLPLRASLQALRYLRVGVGAVRTLDFLLPSLQAAGLARLLLVEPLLAPMGSVGAIAHGGGEPFQGEVDIVIYWQDATLAFSPTRLLDTDAEQDSLAPYLGSLREPAEGLRRQCGAEIMVTTTVLPREDRLASIDAVTPGTAASFVDKANLALAQGAASGEWLLCDTAALAADIGYGDWFDPMRLHDVKAPFAMVQNPVVGDFVARHLASRFGKARRALVLDLDNTVWGGVIGDDGVEGIEIGQGTARGEAFLALQRLALELKRRGVALCVCSKNNEDTARMPFSEHPDMLLREADMAIFHASWDDKATGIRAIAETMRLGLESLAFIDDNPAERARVRQELPFVFVPELPDEPYRYATILAASGAFEHQPLNTDDLTRAGSYAADAQRASVRRTVGNYQEYLRALEMAISITPFDDIGMPRIAQLISKSNQFNVTTRRHGKETLATLQASEDHICWQVRLRDKFSDHGMIAVIIVHTQGKVWTIDTWLQSCRILKRGVEQEIMNRLVETARREGAKQIIGEFIPTPKNALVADLFPTLGFSDLEPSSDDKPGSRLFACEAESYVAHPTEFELESR